jgi:hypothetical protein
MQYDTQLVWLLLEAPFESIILFRLGLGCGAGGGSGGVPLICAILMQWVETRLENDLARVYAC